MRKLIGFAALLILAGGLQGQQPAAPPASKSISTGHLEIYQIELDPTGTAFALTKPELQGDVYVFLAWPDRASVRLPRARVKKITQRTKDLSKEVVYRIDMIPTGRMIAKELPVLKGETFVFHTFREGTLMSLRKSDISGILKLTGIAAFKVQQEERGAALIGDLAMEGGTATVLESPGQPAPARAAPVPAGSTWVYQGMPGVTDGYAPAPSTVSSPGDVPRAPTHGPR